MNDSIIVLFLNGLLALLGWVAHMTGSNQELINALGILILIDWFTGISKSIALKRDITSKIGLAGILSKGSLILIPLIIALVGTTLNLDMSELVGYSIGVICVNEGYSAISNIYVMTTKKDVKEWSMIEILLRKIQYVFRALMNTTTYHVEANNKENKDKEV